MLNGAALPDDDEPCFGAYEKAGFLLFAHLFPSPTVPYVGFIVGTFHVFHNLYVDIHLKISTEGKQVCECFFGTVINQAHESDSSNVVAKNNRSKKWLMVYLSLLF